MTLPLLVPAFLLFRAWARSMSTETSSRALVAGVVAVGCLLAAGWALFTLTVSREFGDASSTFGTTGWIPWSTSALTFALVAIAVAGSTAVAPRTRR